MGDPWDSPSGGGPARPPVQIGDVLADKYVVERLLGVGGMGVVVAARHRELNELRAVKLMRRDATTEPGAVERFLREARAAVRLKSEHAVKVHDVGRLDTGEPYMVMEYLEGTDLKWMLRSRGPLPVAETVGLLLQAIEAIAEAHAVGIVHRDLKPGNLFVTTTLDGQPFVKVLDFGISKLTAGEGEGLDMTKTSSMLGTPYYMSPEQMRSSRKVDARTDIWALGVILYQLLTGRVPFKEETITALCVSVIQDEPVPPRSLRPDIPPELEAVVLCCLQKTPSGRYSNVADLAAAMAPFGPPDARVSAGRIGRLVDAGGATPSGSALGSGGFSAVAPEGGADGTEHLAPTTPLRAPAIVDSAATAASWGRTGPLDRSRLSSTGRAVVATSVVALLALTTVLVLVLSGAPGESAGGESAPPSAAAASEAGGDDSAAHVPVVATVVGAVTSDTGQGGAGGAEAEPHPSAARRPVVRRPYVRSKPEPKPEPKPKQDDPFGSGRK